MNNTTDAFDGLLRFLELAPEHGGRLTDRIEFAYFLPEVDELDQPSAEEQASLIITESGLRDDDIELQASFWLVGSTLWPAPD